MTTINHPTYNTPIPYLVTAKGYDALATRSEPGAWNRQGSARPPVAVKIIDGTEQLVGVDTGDHTRQVVRHLLDALRRDKPLMCRFIAAACSQSNLVLDTNTAATIDRCLAHLADYGDDLIVLDITQAEQLAEQLDAATTNTDPCGRSGCDRLHADGDRCDIHGGDL